MKKENNRFLGAFAHSVISILSDINSNIKELLSYCLKKNNTQNLKCSYQDVDETKMYRGYDIVINENLTIRQPSIGEIVDYGEKYYYTMIHNLCSVGADLKWQLDDIGIDYTQIPDYELFYSVISRTFTANQTKILFGDKINLSSMQIVYNEELKENVLIQYFDDGNYLQIDKYVYNAIVNTIRKMHRMKRNGEIPGNESTRKILIEDAREEYEINKNKPYKPYLLNLISSLVNSDGFKRDDISVFDMKIYAFMDSIARIGKIKNSELLLQSGYSGFGIDLKKLNKEDTNWLGEL